MPANETVLYRGAQFELGRGPGFYGIWPAGAPRPPSIEWWPDTPEGWQGAWSRFTGLETPAAVTAVSPPDATFPPGGTFPGGTFPGRPFAGGTLPPGAFVPAGPPSAAATVSRARAVAAAALLAVGVACGIAGLFPGYFGSASLAQQASQLVPHVIYLAVWTASALLSSCAAARWPGWERSSGWGRASSRSASSSPMPAPPSRAGRTAWGPASCSRSSAGSCAPPGRRRRSGSGGPSCWAGRTGPTGTASPGSCSPRPRRSARRSRSRPRGTATRCTPPAARSSR